MKVRRTAVSIVFELVDPLAEYRGLLAALQHALQRHCAMNHDLGMSGEQVEEPLFLRQEIAKPTQHKYNPSFWNGRQDRPVTKLS
jgi:hypothetical protein